MHAAPPPDTLYLWFLGTPRAPALVGELNLVMSRRGVSLKYADSWIKAGFPLSEDLPLTDLEHLPREKDTAAGAVDDARPDRWGQRVIRLVDRPPRLSVPEYLYYAGDDRFGALGSPCPQRSINPGRSAPCRSSRRSMRSTRWCAGCSPRSRSMRARSV